MKTMIAAIALLSITLFGGQAQNSYASQADFSGLEFTGIYRETGSIYSRGGMQYTGDFVTVTYKYLSGPRKGDTCGSDFYYKDGKVTKLDDCRGEQYTADEIPEKEKARVESFLQNKRLKKR